MARRVSRRRSPKRMLIYNTYMLWYNIINKMIYRAIYLILYYTVKDCARLLCDDLYGRRLFSLSVSDRVWHRFLRYYVYHNNNNNIIVQYRTYMLLLLSSSYIHIIILCRRTSAMYKISYILIYTGGIV